MKKQLIALLLAAVLVIAAGCAAKVPAAETPETTDVPEAGPVTGGWAVPIIEPAVIPEEAQAAFDAAMEGFTGVGYVPAAYLGSQVVAGVNYAFLCQARTVTAEPVVSMAVVTVYAAPDGTTEIKDIRQIDPGAYTAAESTLAFDGELLGGWYIEDAVGTELPENAEAAFEQATGDLTGVGYAPLACLGTQIVAGTNFAVLCKATTVIAEPASALAVMVIYAGLDGSVEILNIAPFSIA